MNREALARCLQIAEHGELDESDMLSWHNCVLGCAVSDGVLTMLSPHALPEIATTGMETARALNRARAADFARQLGLDFDTLHAVFVEVESAAECAQGIRSILSSDARKICRAFDAAEERESTEIGI